MKAAVICLMCLVVASVESKAFGRQGQYYRVMDSFENGVWDTSLEWIPQRGYTGGATTRSRSRPQQVADLTRLLNSGTMDFSDEYVLRTVMNNPERFQNRPYVVDRSGEVHFLPPGSSAAGGYTPQGTGVQPVKK